MYGGLACRLLLACGVVAAPTWAYVLPTLRPQLRGLTWGGGAVGGRPERWSSNILAAQGRRLCISMTDGFEQESMLLEAKRQILHIGDVENIAMFVKMLKIAKDALTGALRSNSGKMSGMSANLIMELSTINPLSQPARDELMGRNFEFLSCPNSENARFQLGSTIRFSIVNTEETPLVDDDAQVTKKKKKKSAPQEQGGVVNVHSQGAGGGDVCVGAEGSWVSSGHEHVSIMWNGSAEGETLRVLYLDRELVILEPADGTAPWILAWLQ